MKPAEFCLMILLLTIGAQFEVRSMTPEDIAYRLLKSHTNSGPPSVTNYYISVDRFLDRQQVERLICEVLQKEKPAASSILTLSIYYKLDKLPVTAGIPGLEKKLFSYCIADYAWNATLHGNPKRLWIYIDSRGNSLSPAEAYEFDHTKTCNQQK